MVPGPTAIRTQANIDCAGRGQRSQVEANIDHAKYVQRLSELVSTEVGAKPD